MTCPRCGCDLDVHRKDYSTPYYWCPECMKRWGDVEYDGPDTVEEKEGLR